MSIWSDTLFAEASGDRLRDFVGRVFSIADVVAVEVRRDEGFARVKYKRSRNPARILQGLSRALGAASRAIDASTGAAGAVRSLFLEGPRNLPIEINRVGPTLSSWRVRYASDRRVRLSHPLLRRRRDVAYQLEQSLHAVLGVRGCRANTAAGSITIVFEPSLVSIDRLLRQLERVWPSLLGHLDGPPSRKRLVAAGGLLGLAATGQFIVPATRPLAVLGIAIYGSTNVTTAIRQLLRFRVGLPALYTFGLGLMLLSGMPFNATVFAVLMQVWPQLAHGTWTRGQRQLFGSYREQPTWARLCLDGGGDIDVDVDTIKEGEIIAVRQGDVLPLDGIVVEGLAAVEEEALSGVAGAVDKAPGDAVFATSYVRDGELKVRVGGTSGSVVARQIADVLPRLRLEDLPSTLEVERIANRNARPALALGVASLFLSQLARPSQAIIRPDYVTAPRLGTQLAALHNLGDALSQGIVFKRPGALDWLAATDVYVFDESAALSQRGIEIAEVFAVDDAAADHTVRYAAAAFPPMQNERVRALQAHCRLHEIPLPEMRARRRSAGRVAYLDGDNHRLEIDSAASSTGALAMLPGVLRSSIEASDYAKTFDPTRWPADHLLRPLIVRRDGEVIGAIAFRRASAHDTAETIAKLRALNRRARFLHVSSKPQREADALARRLGIDDAIGGLDSIGKARVIQQHGERTIWIGDGTATASGPSIGVARVSISVAGFRGIATDMADIVLLQPNVLGLLPLRRIARAHRAMLDGDYRVMYASNLPGVVGGLLANFGGLQSGLISNAGTAVVYLRHRNRLRRLAKRFARTRQLRATAGREDGSDLTSKLDAGEAEGKANLAAPRPALPGEQVANLKGI